MAEWLRNGLQNRVPRFNSGRGLQLHQSTGKRHSVAPTADAARSLPRISGATDFERATAKARARAALGRRHREYPVAEPGRIANREIISSA